MGWKEEQRSGCGKAAECALARGFVKSSELFRFVRSLSNGQSWSNGCHKSHNGCGREDEARGPLCAGGLSGAEKVEDSVKGEICWTSAARRSCGTVKGSAVPNNMIGLARLDSSPERMT